MNEFKVLAVKDLNFVNDQGEKVAGLQFWILGQTADPSWITGTETMKIWIPYGHQLEATVRGLRSGDSVWINFNHRGKIQQLSLTPAA